MHRPSALFLCFMLALSPQRRRLSEGIVPATPTRFRRTAERVIRTTMEAVTATAWECR